MLVLSNNVVFLLSMSILFILLFLIIDNNTILTVQSSPQDTQTTKKSNPDITSNFTNVQWKKFVHETIGISLEYPSHWEVGTGREGYYHIFPNMEVYPEGGYPWGTELDFSYGEPPFDNLKVLTRMIATDVLDRSSTDTQYQFIIKPTIEKYNIDGEKAGSFSYREIHDSPETSLYFVLNVEEIILIHDGKFFNFKFSYDEGDFDEEYITKIKDHMFNSINWIGNETVKENLQSLNNQSISVKEPKDPLIYDNGESKSKLNSSRLISQKINNTNNQNNEIKDITTTFKTYTNHVIGIELQYPFNWYLDNKVNSSCMEKICNVFLYRNLISNDSSNIETINKNSVVLVILGGSIHSQVFKEKCKCDISLLEFVKFAYTNFFQNNERLTFVNDNETTISGNVSAWQLEFDIANPSNDYEDDLQKDGKMWIILTINNDVFYILGYVTEEKLYDKYLLEVKKIIKSIELIPTLEFKKAKQPSFILSLNQEKEEEKQKTQQKTTTINNNTDIGKKIITNKTLLVEDNINNESLETTSTLDQKQKHQQPKKNTTLTEVVSESNTLQILSYDSYIDSMGDMHVIGEVKNNTPKVVQYVEIIGTFYDNKNKVVGTSSAFTTPTDLAPGEIAPFDLILYESSIPQEQIERYALKISQQ